MVIKILSVLLFAFLTAAANYAAYKYVKKKETEISEYGEDGEAQPVGKLTVKWAVCFGAVLTVTAIVIGIFIFDRTTSLVNFYKIAFIFAVTDIIAFTDIRLRLIPNVFTLTLLGGGVVFHLLNIFASGTESFRQFLIYYLISAVIVLLILCAMSAITHSGMGLGDIKYLCSLCFTGGVLLLLISLTVSLIYSLIYGLALMIIKKKKMKDTLPFGPFILAGVLTCIVTGLM